MLGPDNHSRAHLGGEGVLGQAVCGVHVEQVHLAGGQRGVLLHPGLPPHVPRVQDGLHRAAIFTIKTYETHDTASYCMSVRPCCGLPLTILRFVAEARGLVCWSDLQSASASPMQRSFWSVRSATCSINCLGRLALICVTVVPSTLPRTLVCAPDAVSSQICATGFEP